MKLHKWIYFFGGGIVVSCLLLPFCNFPCMGNIVKSSVWGNLIEGAWGGVAARFFTCSNIAILLVPVLVFFRVLAVRYFDFFRKLPTMIGMLGTLWSLLAADLNNPGALASKFSVAIVSTFVGIIVQILVELLGRMLKIDGSDSEGE